jgi:hypothetical protein
MKPKEFVVRFFTWWNGATLGTLFWSARHGEFVGSDEYGNRYYRMKGGRIDPTLGFERRYRSDPRLRAALGDLQGTRRSLDHRSGVARLDAPHRRYATHRREGHATPVVEAAPAQPHRYSRGLPPDRLDTDQKPSPQGDRRLQAVGPRPLKRAGSIAA